MVPSTPEILFFFESILFATVIFMNIAKKNFEVVALYGIQSLIISLALFNSFLEQSGLLLLTISILTFFVKVIVAPYFFFGLIKKHNQILVSSYLNIPTTLIALSLLIAFTSSQFFSPLVRLSSANGNALFLALGMIFISIFLIINRKGVLSQMVGILSLENGIVSFAYITGLETAAGSQIGILFDILVWVIIATLFAKMIYKHFGSLDASAMRQLKEE